jgi:hypothetical protein
MTGQRQNIDKIAESYYFIYCNIATTKPTASAVTAREGRPACNKKVLLCGLYFPAALAQIRQIGRSQSIYRLYRFPEIISERHL